MNKDEFINEVAKQKGMSKKQAYKAVNATMDTIRILLLQGEEVNLGGFGTFKVVTDLKNVRIPVLKGGTALKRVLNTLGNTEENY